MMRLRPYKPCDAGQIAGWFSDERTMRRWCAAMFPDYPLTPEALNAYYDARQDNPEEFPMTAFDEEGLVGHLLLRFLDPERTTVWFGLVVVNSSRRGQHLGREMLRLCLGYAFAFLGAEKVTLGVFDCNEAARRCYTALGFREVPDPKGKPYAIFGEQWHLIPMEYRRDWFSPHPGREI